ncbi:MAG: S8 family serine peptidase [Candidatus Magasanikbacteria bacterium]|nr:S8 family serine peptidase [Candidatus Magasanikbacteria bacterium]
MHIGLIRFTAVLALISVTLPSVAIAALPQDPYATQWSFADTGVYEVWNDTRERRIPIIAIIDNGFDTFHPDLAQNVWKNTDEIPENNIDDDANGYIDDVWGWDFVGQDNDPRPTVEDLTPSDLTFRIVHHATAVAGIIGAVHNNDIGGAGILKKVQLMNLRILDHNGAGNFDFLDEAIRYAVDNGATVINLSIVGNELTEEIKQAVRYANQKNVAIVAAAGNSRSYLTELPQFPVCIDAHPSTTTILGVSAINQERRSAMFSNYGSDCIDITAPGEHISSTLRYSPRFGLSDMYGNNWNGTSFAAPFVSAAAALVQSIQPHWTVHQVYDAVLKNVHKTPTNEEEAYRHIFGAGLVQVQKVMHYAYDQLLGNAPSVTEFLALHSTGKEIYRYNQSTKTFSETPLSSPITYDFLASETDTEGNTFFWTSTFFPKKNVVEITQYSFSGTKILSWSFPSKSPMQLVVGNVLDTAKNEIILVPSGTSDVVYHIWSTTGKKLREKTLGHTHSGVRVALESGNNTEIHNIVTLIGNTVEHSRGTGEPFKTVSLEELTTGGSFAIADFTGDGVSEYLVGPSQNQPSHARMYTYEGELLKKWITYDGGYQDGFSFVIADYTGDGLSDVATVPVNGSVPIRFWSHKIKLLAEWTPFQQGAQLIAR